MKCEKNIGACQRNAKKIPSKAKKLEKDFWKCQSMLLND